MSEMTSNEEKLKTLTKRKAELENMLDIREIALTKGIPDAIRRLTEVGKELEELDGEFKVIAAKEKYDGKWIKVDDLSYGHVETVLSYCPRVGNMEYGKYEVKFSHYIELSRQQCYLALDRGGSTWPISLDESTETVSVGTIRRILSEWEAVYDEQRKKFKASLDLDMGDGLDDNEE